MQPLSTLASAMLPSYSNSLNYCLKSLNYVHSLNSYNAKPLGIREEWFAQCSPFSLCQGTVGQCAQQHSNNAGDKVRAVLLLASVTTSAPSLLDSADGLTFVDEAQRRLAWAVATGTANAAQRAVAVVLDAGMDSSGADAPLQVRAWRS